MIEYWYEWLFLVLVGICEFYLSWLNHRINYFTFRKKTWRATKYDLIANILAEGIPFFMYVYAQKWVYIIPRILANTAGTHRAASRKPKQDGKVKRKKVPFTTV